MSSHAISTRQFAHAAPRAQAHSQTRRGRAGAIPAPRVKPHPTPSARRIVLKELPPFTRGLAAMLDAGMPLDQSLAAMGEQVESRPFRNVITQLRTSVQHGNRLSAALTVYPDVFDAVFISMLKSGEISGRMAETLERLADHLEMTADLRHKVQSAMMYPLAVASIAVILATAILIWIVPAFERIYADLGGTLPMATRILIGISAFVRTNILFCIAAVVLTVITVRILKRTRNGRYAWDRMTLSMPVFGPLLQKVALARFCEATSQMLHNGVPILQALDLAADVVNNSVLGQAMQRARVAVEQGSTFSATLKENRWYPPLLIQMLATGEKTGRMDEMLDRLSRFYRNEVTVTVNGLTSLIEPLLIVFLGVVVGGMVVCMFIPIFRLTEIVKF